MSESAKTSYQDDRVSADQMQGGRDYQEDDYKVSCISAPADETSGELLMVLADGMGGHAGGAEASDIAVRYFTDHFIGSDGAVNDRFMAALDAANNGLEQEVEKNPDLEGMGCTLVGLHLTDQGARWISVGDSPLYLVSSGRIVQINDDHSMAPVLAQFVKEGRMTAEEASKDPRRNALRSAVVGEELTLIDLPHDPLPIHKGDVLVLASDGLQTLPNAKINDIVVKHGDKPVDQLVEKLLQAVTDAGRRRQDNTTVMVYRADRLLGEEPRSDDLTIDPNSLEEEMDAIMNAGSAGGADEQLPLALIAAGIVAIVGLGVVAYMALM
ncbi:MAG: protein phosphatase 2C domain-containing protein [Alphaproteobacteria bacterium]